MSASESRGLRLQRIRKSRVNLLVCFYTLPLYATLVWILLSRGQSVDAIMFVYMALYAVFAVIMANQRCPNCEEQFYVKTVFLNLIKRQCVHCGQSYSEEAN